VTVRATSPSCTLIASIMQAVEDRLREVEGVRSVEVELDVHAMWTPELMTGEGTEKLSAARQRTIDEARLRPRGVVAGG
jgi:metal-sulfur cluster biosynthetic enzyme